MHEIVNFCSRYLHTIRYNHKAEYVFIQSFRVGGFSVALSPVLAVKLFINLKFRPPCRTIKARMLFKASQYIARFFVQDHSLKSQFKLSSKSSTLIFYNR